MLLRVHKRGKRNQLAGARFRKKPGTKRALGAAVRGGGEQPLALTQPRAPLPAAQGQPGSGRAGPGAPRTAERRGQPRPEPPYGADLLLRRLLADPQQPVEVQLQQVLIDRHLGATGFSPRRRPARAACREM